MILNLQTYETDRVGYNESGSVSKNTCFSFENPEHFQKRDRTAQKQPNITIVGYPDESTSSAFDSKIIRDGKLPNSTYETILAKLRRFRSFKDGWNGEDTFSPNENAINKVFKILTIYKISLKDRNVTSANIQIFPLDQGGIMMEFSGKLNMELEIRNQSPLIEYFITNDIDLELEGEVDLSQVGLLFLKIS